MSWRNRNEVAVALALLVACWLALAIPGLGGPDRQAFDTTVARSARDGLSNVRTAWLVGDAHRDGRVTRTYLSPVLDRSIRAVATAQLRLAETPPPGRAQAAVRDALRTLLDEGERAIGDLVGAVYRGDTAGVRATVAALGAIGDRLADFVDRYPS